MALSRGMTALRAALGAVGGGLEGYAQFQAMEQKRKMEEEAARRAELGMLISSKQVRLRPVSRAGGGEPVGAVESPPPVATDSTLSRALQIGAETAPSQQATAPAPRTTPQKTALQVRREALQDLQSAFDAYAVPGEANPWDPTEQVTPEKVTSAKAEIDKYIRALEVQATTDPSLRQAATNLEQERKAGYDFYRQMRSQQFGQELSEEPMRPLIASANIIDALRQEGEQRRAMAVPRAQAAPTGPITDREVATPQPPARPAGRPPVTSVGRVTLGGQEFDLLPALTPEEEKAQEDAEFDRAIAGFSEEEKKLARLARLLPPNVLQMMQPKEGRQPRVQLNEKTGQIINLDTREVFNIPGYKQPPKEAKAESDKPKFGEVASLRREFNTQAKTYSRMNDALKIIQRLGTKENPTPQDIQALTYAFVKVQDADSVVRESEYANAERASSLLDRIQNYPSLIGKGQRLTAKQRQDMVKTATELLMETMNQYGALADSYEELATSFNMDPKQIVPNRIDKGFKKPTGGTKPSTSGY